MMLWGYMVAELGFPGAHTRCEIPEALVKKKTQPESVQEIHGQANHRL